MKKILILTLFCLLAALPSYAGPRYVEGEAIAAIKMTPAGNVAAGVMSAKTSAAASASSTAVESGAELIQVFSPIAAGGTGRRIRKEDILCRNGAACPGPFQGRGGRDDGAADNAAEGKSQRRLGDAELYDASQLRNPQRPEVERTVGF